ncbi:FAD-dependent oxidoreductase [Granulicella sibirica]|uniref:FAD-dependent oxidoreductase n=1 Tax=Granulicella sibirica TaxID=2479048 RepID=UPI00240E507D|nr:FAD-dependent oxidoreductase [Granulicella sibirica]
MNENEWIIRQGESPSFFVLLEGTVQCEKEYGGTATLCLQHVPGDFFGEAEILLDSVAIASLQAHSRCRLLRLDPIQFKDMLSSSRRCNDLVVEVMTERLKFIREHMQSNDQFRVEVTGSSDDPGCREVRTFLSQNHIGYRWRDHGPKSATEDGCGGSSLIVDGVISVGCPLTARKAADALGIKTRPSDKCYDLVIVGGGPAGLAAAVSGASEGLRVLLVEKDGIGGQAACSTRIENYPGFPSGISGNDLGSRALKQAIQFGADIIMTRRVCDLYPMANGYCLELDGAERVETQVVLIATGVQWRRLEAEGVESLIGRGVLYGASRTEGRAALGKNVFIVGGGNSAGQAAMFFSEYAATVTLLVRGAAIEETMSTYLMEQIQRRSNIIVEPSTEVVKAEGGEHLESIYTCSNGVIRKRLADALFVMIGAVAHSDWLSKDIQRDQSGFILTGEDVRKPFGKRAPVGLETSMEGVFCAGDIRFRSVKRVSASVGEGSMAISYIHQYLSRKQVYENRMAS